MQNCFVTLLTIFWLARITTKATITVCNWLLSIRGMSIRTCSILFVNSNRFYLTEIIILLMASNLLLLNMSLRVALKVPKYGLFYFKLDRTISVVQLSKIVKVISGNNFISIFVIVKCGLVVWFSKNNFVMYTQEAKT